MNAGDAARGRADATRDPEVGADLDRIPVPQLILRVMWIAVQTTLAFMLADKASPFFYQQF